VDKVIYMFGGKAHVAGWGLRYLLEKKRFVLALPSEITVGVRKSERL